MWEVLEKIDIAYGIWTLVIGFLGYLLGKFGYRIRFWMRDLMSKHAKSEGVVLAVYRKDNSRDSITKYLNEHKELKYIRENARVFVNTKERYCAGDLDGILKQVKEKYALARKTASADIIHLFLDTTVVLGTLIAAPYYNRGIVHLYHWDKDQATYVYQGRLNRE